MMRPTLLLLLAGLAAAQPDTMDPMMTEATTTTTTEAPVPPNATTTTEAPVPETLRRVCSSEQNFEAAVAEFFDGVTVTPGAQVLCPDGLASYGLMGTTAESVAQLDACLLGECVGKTANPPAMVIGILKPEDMEVKQRLVCSAVPRFVSEVKGAFGMAIEVATDMMGAVKCSKGIGYVVAPSTPEVQAQLDGCLMGTNTSAAQCTVPMMVGLLSPGGSVMTTTEAPVPLTQNRRVCSSEQNFEAAVAEFFDGVTVTPGAQVLCPDGLASYGLMGTTAESAAQLDACLLGDECMGKTANPPAMVIGILKPEDMKVKSRFVCSAVEDFISKVKAAFEMKVDVDNSELKEVKCSKNKSGYVLYPGTPEVQAQVDGCLMGTNTSAAQCTVPMTVGLPFPGMGDGSDNGPDAPLDSPLDKTPEDEGLQLYQVCVEEDKWTAEELSAFLSSAKCLGKPVETSEQNNTYAGCTALDSVVAKFQAEEGLEAALATCIDSQAWMRTFVVPETKAICYTSQNYTKARVVEELEEFFGATVEVGTVMADAPDCKGQDKLMFDVSLTPEKKTLFDKCTADRSQEECTAFPEWMSIPEEVTPAPTEDEGGLETWVFAVIGVGAVLFIGVVVVLVMKFRKPRVHMDFGEQMGALDEIDNGPDNNVNFGHQMNPYNQLSPEEGPAV